MRPPALTRPGTWLEDLAEPAGVLAAQTQQRSEVITASKILKCVSVTN